MIGDGKIFSIEGDLVTGEFGIRGSIVLPEGNEGIEATDHQMFAVQDFYKIDFPSLSFGQASQLLSFREYARHCVDAIFKGHSNRLRVVFARFVAMYITHVPDMASFAVRWSERNFASGTGSPRVKGTPFYLDVRAICGQIFDEAIRKGFDFRDL